MNYKLRWFQFLFSSFFLGMAIFILLSDWAKENINGMIITLFLIAFSPWMVGYIKSVDIFGMKVELVTDEQKKKVNDALEQPEDKSFYHCKALDSILNTEDFVSKLVIGRFELEKIIWKLAKKYHIDCTENPTSSHFARELFRQHHISKNELEVIEELMPILNKAVHSNLNAVEQSQLQWIILKVIKIVQFLNVRYEKVEMIDERSHFL